ncbi:hypothetical protein [Mycobacterium sp. AT1]|uniref:hypothetical protein n=1 Tax=Mycobacterium sp. AT1 TaxID=1961706 RepID=UPI0009AEE64B|nr:hypothetical protein [Mycobacterium sp. AT1]OPX06947.1 hypothetical protein B1790_25265 [Mycobacterium sp. AT1]
MKLVVPRLRQRDGVTCGPTVALMAGALLDPGYRANLADPRWSDAEQGRVHAVANRIWPRTLGTTPWGMAKVVSVHSAAHRVRYGWRLARPGDELADVERAVRARWPVAMLIGNVIPRHWVLLVGCDGMAFDCYEPSSGEVRRVPTAAIPGAQLQVLGFPRPFAFVLPRSNI